MSILDLFRNLIGKRPKSGSRTYEISESLQVTLTTIAKHEGRPEHELLPDVLAAGLSHYVTKGKLWNLWGSLTPREKDVAAFEADCVAVRDVVTDRVHPNLMRQHSADARLKRSHTCSS